MVGVTFKPGVLPIGKLAPAGVRILGALDQTARACKVSLVVTCADKEHPPNDPHSTGDAFDVRTHNLPEDTKHHVLQLLISTLADDAGSDAPLPISIGFATTRFYAQLEHPGLPNEHLHVQLRNGVIY